MPVSTPDQAESFALHGSVFRSYVSPSRGSSTLCAWQLEVAAGTVGTGHRPDREEILLVQAGELHAEVDEVAAVLAPGAVLVVPAGARLVVGAGPAGATVWVTTTAGLTATTDDGAVIHPPWAR